jgi:hypothetical protein
MGGRAHSGAHFIGRASRWFRRRSQRVRSALSQETCSRSRSHSNSISNSSKQSEFSQKREKPKREKEIEDKEQEEEELGILGLKLIRVPVRWNMAGFDHCKKVLIYFSFHLNLCNEVFCRKIWSFTVYVGWV